MLSQRMWYSLGVGGTAVGGALLLGLTKIFDIEPKTNMLSTGITPGQIFGILLVIISIAIYKHKI